MRHPATFHAGEIAAQDRAGVSPRLREMASQAIRDAMPTQHREFFESLPLVFVALLDRGGRPWALPVSGAPGFARADSPQQLSLNSAPVLASEFDLDTAPGARIGLLGIDFATRRRNRVNGRISSGIQGLEITVDQSFGNCPKYIRTRAFGRRPGDPPRPARRRVGLDSDVARRIIVAADTFFIASRGAHPADHANEGLDVSHRGGRPGFLGISGGGTLCFPDFSGNQYFNTLGNIETDGRVGLVIPDFASGDAIFVTGKASIDWTPDRAAAVVGAERVVDLEPEEIWHVEYALSIHS